MSSKIADFNPKRVWMGTTVPGKKMMVMISEPGAGLQRGRDLIDLYEHTPFDAIIAVCFALDVLPTEGAKFGPALRDLVKDTHPFMFYGAILTDIRDFLKLRFRAKGLAENEEVARVKLNEVIGAGDLQETLSKGDPELVVGYVINYAITALDTISKKQTPEVLDIAACLKPVNDLLKATARWLCPWGQDHFDKYIAAINLK